LRTATIDRDLDDYFAPPDCPPRRGFFVAFRVRPKILSHISKSYERCGTAIFAKHRPFSFHPQFLRRQLFDKTHLVSNRTLKPKNFYRIDDELSELGRVAEAFCWPLLTQLAPFESASGPFCGPWNRLGAWQAPSVNSSTNSSSNFMTSSLLYWPSHLSTGLALFGAGSWPGRERVLGLGCWQEDGGIRWSVVCGVSGLSSG
jgi:hypothetical protein